MVLNVFSSFRQRLLFWFLVFIGSSLVIGWLSVRYITARERLLELTRQTEQTYWMLLKDVQFQQGFISYDTKSPDFFITGTSPHLLRHDSILLCIQKQVKLLSADYYFMDSARIITQMKHADLIFQQLVLHVKERGYKDYSLEGAMRVHAHWLQENPKVAEQAFRLRRHEKDYIIRNETTYVEQFNQLIGTLLEKYDTPDSLHFHLSQYKKNFNELVRLDNIIGIKDNTGLKRQLDESINQLELSFSQYLRQAQAYQEEQFRMLTIQFMGLGIGLLIISVLASLLIARSITKPLIELTHFISRFVDSNFLIDEGNPIIKSKDEIGELTQNFTVLKDEVISRLKFFKQKVDERTTELAEANERLIRLNEANSRFVPNEFLHFLSRTGIEQVRLGDFVEKEMTVMFTDIRSFTRLSESFTPQQNFDFLNAYLGRIVPIIKRNHGFIDKYIGDSIMALFAEGPYGALQAGLEIQDAVNLFNRETGNEIEVGTGIHTGKLILGTIGHDQRMETTVISDAVNIAARVEGLTKHYQCQVMVTEDCIQQLRDRSKFRLRFIDHVQVKGKSTHLSVYEVLGAHHSLSPHHLELYHQAISLLQHREIEAASACFVALLSVFPSDHVLKLYHNRCEELIKNGIPENWDGVQVMLTK